MSTVDSICSIVIFHICMSLFESTLLSFCEFLASVIFFISFVVFFLSLLPWRSVGGPISTGVCKKSIMLIQITTYKYEKLLCIYSVSFYKCPRLIPFLFIVILLLLLCRL